MFSAKPYHQVNREERCHVALMAHALLLSSQARSALCRLIANRTTPRLELDPTHLEVYVEAACLRDYWRDLGSAVIYNNTTHTARRNVLEEILQAVALSSNVLDTHGVFWTSGHPNQGKLWSPGRWNE